MAADYGDEDGEGQEEYADDEDEDEDQESVYTEGELMTRMKLMKQKSYSAPYILLLDCFDEPLCDSESQMLEHACSTTMLQNIDLKEEEDVDDEGEGVGSSEKKPYKKANSEGGRDDYYDGNADQA